MCRYHFTYFTSEKSVLGLQLAPVSVEPMTQGTIDSAQPETVSPRFLLELISPQPVDY
jgi:hypothetical protein